MPVTERLARACSRHPWVTMSAWGVAIVLALAAVALLLPGRLTTEGAGTNNPQSQRAESAIGHAGLFGRQNSFTGLVIVRSDRYAVGSAPFTKFLLAQRAVAAQLGGNLDATQLASLPVSRDRRAVLIPIDVDEDQIADVISAVKLADAAPGFSVSVTGEKTLDHDFNDLSQHDLKTGRGQFGLPAAL